MLQIRKFISNKKVYPSFKSYTAIIGLAPSKGARSPALWNAAFKGYKIKNQMIPLDVNSKKLFKLLNALEKDQNFIGGCVTISHKERVFKWLKRRITKSSRKIGAVNCIFRDQSGNLKGTNTDGEAALESFKKKFGKVNNKKIILIGPGGAGKAVSSYFIAEMLKKSNLTIVGRSKLSKKFSKKIGSKWINFNSISKINLKKFDIVINCSSIGFDKQKNKSPLTFLQLRNASKKLNIFDIIYKPQFTKLLLNSRKNKLRILNGLDMNLRQAVLAFGYTNNKLKKNKKTLTYMRSI